MIKPFAWGTKCDVVCHLIKAVHSLQSTVQSRSEQVHGILYFCSYFGFASCIHCGLSTILFLLVLTLDCRLWSAERGDSPCLPLPPGHNLVPILMSSLILLFDSFQFLLNNQPNPRARDPFDPVIYPSQTQSPRPPQFREKTVLALLMG